jgi:hypothetical protein
VLAALDHNPIRWVAAPGLGHVGPVVAKTLRRRFITVPGRLTHSAAAAACIVPADGPCVASSSPPSSASARYRSSRDRHPDPARHTRVPRLKNIPRRTAPVQRVAAALSLGTGV